MFSLLVQNKQPSFKANRLKMETATIIVRVIRSFEYRNIRNIVLHNVLLSITTEDLKSKIFKELLTAPGLPPPFRNFDYDTLKVTRAIKFMQKV